MMRDVELGKFVSSRSLLDGEPIVYVALGMNLSTSMSAHNARCGRTVNVWPYNLYKHMCISLFLDCAGNENEQNLEGLIMVTYMESDYHFSMLRWRSDGRLLCGCTHEKSQGKEVIVSVLFLFLFSPACSLLAV